MQEYANGAMRNAQPDSQPTTGSGAVGNVMDAERAESVQLEALREELSKWQ